MLRIFEAKLKAASVKTSVFNRCQPAGTEVQGAVEKLRSLANPHSSAARARDSAQVPLALEPARNDPEIGILSAGEPKLTVWGPGIDAKSVGDNPRTGPHLEQSGPQTIVKRLAQVERQYGRLREVFYKNIALAKTHQMTDIGPLRIAL